MIRNILFYIKEAFLSTKKNGIISLATIVCLTATLIIVGIFLIISLHINNFIANLESDLIAVAYLKDDLSQEEIGKLVQNTSSLEGVREVVYISKEEALQRLKEDLTEHEEILAGLPENPLPSSLEITVFEAGFLDEVSFQVNQFKGIEEVNYGGQLTKNLLIIFDFIRKTGLGIILILLFVSILIMFAVIKISVHSRQQEIEIMTLVGATSWFIRWPFIIEGFLKGLISSLMSFFIIYKAYKFYLTQVKSLIPFISVNLEPDFILRIGITLLFLGVFIGIFGSMLSLRKISYEEL
ncbi:MAG TPA: permease-like cell division protein FtsX [Atribacterota bacterium]|nr:permease-like cell division protein FtsX [Atribacterota bacterium]